ncbi:NUDIX domain-containing protein [Candidatus Woesebacteria bacterium]|nr:NUDIX domain-containing protein [Candidatus Woesebacteria bacterium]MCD8507604.1 NUDIX domain-containing protein [Candidatus Woesebacteria bacterium]MCD8527448.1 NUDIX domain-containing protein [Candidatus Woesebacteria bacterium]MCD8546190.1 NUDIX domain-containing protein [Candidatus Woesebacteria bacterium]
MQITDAAYGFVPFIIKNGEPLYLVTLHHKGHWAFPKGHAEGNETPLEAGLRELREETGLEPKRIYEQATFLEEYTFTDPDGNEVEKTNTFWLAEMPHQEVTPQEAEVDDFAWLPYDEAMERMTFASAKKSLLRAHELFEQYVRE